MTISEAGSERLKAIGYVSRAAEPVSSDELAALEQEAHRSNRAAGVTGLLVFDAGCYIQILEGPAHAVDATLERIRGDGRHEELEQVIDMPIHARSFSHWALASIDLRAPAASVDIFSLAGGIEDFLGRLDAELPGKGPLLMSALRQVLALLDKAPADD
jgi:hypothetical protein